MLSKTILIPPDNLKFGGSDAAPVFAAPWEAHVFALVVALHERGVFTWSEWSTALADAQSRKPDISKPHAETSGYAHWLPALEGLLAIRGLASPGLMTVLKEVWDDAARTTPHGKAIEVATERYEPER